MQCRACNHELQQVFVNLLNAPASNSYLSKTELDTPETYYPLKVYTCSNCFLTQIEEYKESATIFNSGYAYFSSFSKSWLRHAEQYVEMITARLKLTSNSSVTEIASNDGYLLKNFVKKSIPCIGIEPTQNTAAAAKAHGIFSYTEFWSNDFAKEFVAKHGKQDLILGNNVLAHTPHLNDFIEGLATALTGKGTITVEFPHLLNLIQYTQFDTIYHEHFSYLSLTSIENVFQKHGLEIYDVEELPTHGGSLRLYIKHSANSSLQIRSNVTALRDKEISFGLQRMATYTSFQNKVDMIKYKFLDFLLQCKKTNKHIIAYGAAAKGNTLLNYCGVKGTDLIEYVVDASIHKQGKYLPGSHIPIVDESHINCSKPDYVLILPWNLSTEIAAQLAYIQKWGGKFVTCIPELCIF